MLKEKMENKISLELDTQNKVEVYLHGILNQKIKKKN